MDKHRKQIAFDLDTKMLEIYYPTANWRKAYDDIKHHMVNNGFDWIQGSVYVSKEKMSSSDVTIMLKALRNKNPWLNKCMRDCRETNIGRSHSKNSIFDKNANIPTREEQKKKKREKFNLKDIKPGGKWAKKQEEKEANRNNKQVRKDRNKGIGD